MDGVENCIHLAGGLVADLRLGKLNEGLQYNVTKWDVTPGSEIISAFSRTS